MDLGLIAVGEVYAVGRYNTKFKVTQVGVRKTTDQTTGPKIYVEGHYIRWNGQSELHRIHRKEINHDWATEEQQQNEHQAASQKQEAKRQAVIGRYYQIKQEMEDAGFETLRNTVSCTTKNNEPVVSVCVPLHVLIKLCQDIKGE